MEHGQDYEQKGYNIGLPMDSPIGSYKRGKHAPSSNFFLRKKWFFKSLSIVRRLYGPMWWVGEWK